MKYKNLQFPSEFLWGSATSAYQVEGGIENADWSVFKSAGAACDHYHRYQEDFDIAADELNQNAHRFSIEWSRIEPQEGKFDETELEHYRHVLEYLKQKNMTTMVTLHHFTTPQWLAARGSWEHREVVPFFARFVRKVAEDLASLVDYWCTINEPVIYATLSYGAGEWPPAKQSKRAVFNVLRHQVAAHKLAYQALHAIDANAQVGLVKNNQYFEPYSNSVLDNLTVWFNSWVQNRLFLNRVRDHLDFIGLNYYFHTKLQFPYRTKNDNEVTSDLGWEIYPEGLYHVLRDLKSYNLPIYITENGVADARDSLRAEFIRDHIAKMNRARAEGVDVRGYFHWSLLDNFEWADGFGPRFGLVAVDYQPGERTIRDSARVYAEIAKQHTQNK